MAKDLTRFAIADLHLHLDGSLSPKVILKIADHENLLLPTRDLGKIRKRLQVSGDCPSLAEYLKKFDLPNVVLQTRYGLREATLDLLRRLKRDGLLYCEIRMAPQLSTRKGLTQDEVVETLVKAMQEGENIYGIKSNLIVCLMRGAPIRENVKTVGAALKYLHEGVVAVDLAGDEAAFPNKDYADFFKFFDEEGIPFTIHAGEAKGPDAVRMLLPYHPSRIGHGIHAYDDEGLIREIAALRLPLEICPKSNLDTKAIRRYEDLHIKELLSLGVVVTINTDDMSVSNTTLRKEYRTLVKLGLDEDDIRQIAINSIESAFLRPRQKEKFLAYLTKL